MNTERLNDLLAVLREVPDVEFDMGKWWKTNCRTVGCAVGHYCVARPDSGLKLAPLTEHGGSLSIPVLASNRNVEEHSAIAEHFGITRRESEFLFHPGSYDYDRSKDIPRAAVIGRIESFIADAESDGRGQGGGL